MKVKTSLPCRESWEGYTVRKFLRVGLTQKVAVEKVIFTKIIETKNLSVLPSAFHRDG